MLKNGQFREAEKYLRVVIANGTNDLSVVINYGIALELIAVQEGNVQLRDDARVCFEKAINIRPIDEANEALAHYQLAYWQSQYGDPATARREVEISLSLNPEYQPAKELLAQLEKK